MIFDDFKNFDLYEIDPIVKNFILNIDPNISTGRHIISDKAYINIDEYKTRDDSEIKLEAHRKYIDIQFMLAGQEKISVCDYKNCSSVIPYDEEKDIEFLNSNDWNDIEMYTGDFLILYPEDAHKPSISINNEQHHVRKLVIKVPVN